MPYRFEMDPAPPAAGQLTWTGAYRADEDSRGRSATAAPPVSLPWTEFEPDFDFPFILFVISFLSRLPLAATCRFGPVSVWRKHKSGR
jgi:hypothetical protein